MPYMILNEHRRSSDPLDAISLDFRSINRGGNFPHSCQFKMDYTCVSNSPESLTYAV